MLDTEDGQEAGKEMLGRGRGKRSPGGGLGVDGMGWRPGAWPPGTGRVKLKMGVRGIVQSVRWSWGALGKRGQ